MIWIELGKPCLYNHVIQQRCWLAGWLNDSLSLLKESITGRWEVHSSMCTPPTILEIVISQLPYLFKYPLYHTFYCSINVLAPSVSAPHCVHSLQLGHWSKCQNWLTIWLTHSSWLADWLIKTLIGLVLQHQSLHASHEQEANEWAINKTKNLAVLLLQFQLSKHRSCTCEWSYISPVNNIVKTSVDNMEE